MNNSLTILLLLKGRPSFTKRWMDYMAAIKFNHKIIIADGDADGVAKKIINHEKYSQLNIEFFEMLQTIKYLDYYKMVLEGINRAQSQFIMLCDNDDFILLSGLNKIVSFLEKNPDHISMGGYISGFKINGGAYLDYGKNFQLSFFYKKIHRLAEPTSNWYQFVHQIMFDFQSSFYNVHRRDVIKKIYSEIVQMNFSDLTVTERYYQFRLPTLGKVAYDPSALHYLRQKGTSSSTNINVPLDLIKSDLPNDIRVMADKVSLFVDEDQKKFKEHILKVYADYLGYYFSHTLLRYRFKNLFKIKNLYNHYLNKTFLYRILSFLEHQKFLSVVKKQTKSLDYKAFQKEIVMISDILKKR